MPSLQLRTLYQRYPDFYSFHRSLRPTGALGQPNDVFVSRRTASSSST
jgi:hypothetical protein